MECFKEVKLKYGIISENDFSRVKIKSVVIFSMFSNGRFVSLYVRVEFYTEDGILNVTEL